MFKVDVFSSAAAVTALLLATGLLIAFAVNRKLTAFPWWAACFLLLAMSLATVTLRINVPPYLVKGFSWSAFYAAACLIAIGLHRDGQNKTNLSRPILAGATLSVAITVLLAVIKAPPHLWMLLGPVPTLAFMAWSGSLMIRSGSRGYALALLSGMAAIVARSVWYATDMMRAAPQPNSALRGAFGPGESRMSGVVDLPADAFQPLLGLGPRLPPPLGEHLAITLITIAALLGLALALVLRELLSALSRMRERSSIDAMTGLLNRVTFDELATALLEEAGQQPVCVVLFDIDHFKRINDTCGHPAGDRVIACLGGLVSEGIDTRTIAGRIGGEEFAVVFKGTNLAAARLYAEAIRTRFSAADLGEDIFWDVTVSAGIAVRLNGETLDAVISRADKALYAAKTGGRDRVVTALDRVAAPRRRALEA